MKTYEIKIYSYDGTFKKTISSNKRKNDISFSSNINGTQGNIEIELNLNIDETLGFTQSDILKVYCFNDTYTTGKVIYIGQIQEIKKQYTENIQAVNITCYGLGTMLSQLIFKSGSDYIFSLDQDPTDTVKDIIDYFNSIYTFGWLSYGNIDYLETNLGNPIETNLDEGIETNLSTGPLNYGSDVNIDFDYTDCFTALKNVASATDFRWFIDGDGMVYFEHKPAMSTHKLTVKKDIQSIIVNEISEDIVNSVFVEYKTGTTGIIEDTTSISTYGKKQKKLTETQLGDLAGATIFANNYLIKNKDTKKQTTIIINNTYSNNGKSIEDIKPGDTVTVLNFPITINNLQVNKVNYNGDEVTIDLEYFLTLSQFF